MQLIPHGIHASISDHLPCFKKMLKDKLYIGFA
jgi:hypothetical protein